MKHLIAALLCGCFTLAQAQTAQELLTDGKNTENITTYGMGYDMKRYSPLKQINTSNVKRLVPVWSMSMANDLGEQAQPMIYNGVMYVTNVNPRGQVFLCQRSVEIPDLQGRSGDRYHA